LKTFSQKTTAGPAAHFRRIPQENPRTGATLAAPASIKMTTFLIDFIFDAVLNGCML
jgi:hypothetical protein